MRDSKLYSLLALSGATAAANLPRIGDFALLDHTGKHHKMSWYGDQKAIVVFVQGNGCPIARNSVPTLKALRDEYADELKLIALLGLLIV